MTLRALPLALALACGTAPEAPPEAAEAAPAAAEAPADAEVTRSEARAEAARPPAREARIPDTDGPYTVVLVVASGMRADHIEPCGSRRPLTPFLQSLVDEHGASLSCTAYAPTVWTLSSLRSILSGRPLYLPGRGPVTPLPQAMEADGYATALVSGDPRLRESPLPKGFDHVKLAASLRDLRHPHVGLAVEDVVSKVKAKDPLLLVVHLTDASDPYPPLEREGWGRAQDWMGLVREPGRPHPFWRRFYADELAVDERARFLLRLEQGLDRGIELADQSIKDVLDALRRQGRPMSNLRLVVVGGTGTFLGEHDLVGEASGTWEPGVRVPLLYLDTHDASKPDLSGVHSATAAWALARSGTLPDDVPAVSVARPPADLDVLGRPMVSLWTDGQPKLSWREGSGVAAFDLAEDPRETRPLPAAGHPRLAELRSLVEHLQPYLDGDDR